MKFKTVESRNSDKLDYDQYYTPYDIMVHCVDKALDIVKDLGYEISEFLEPSAGEGVFLDYLDKPYLAYDIEPEDDRIIQADWLGVNLEYKKGRCVIGNPPFGSRNTLSVQFYKQSVKLSDYISFILPISQFNNNQQMYEFDLIYSEDLKKRNYSDREIHCCFNIYKRNSNGTNKRPDCKLKDVSIKEDLVEDSLVSLNVENVEETLIEDSLVSLDDVEEENLIEDSQEVLDDDGNSTGEYTIVFPYVYGFLDVRKILFINGIEKYPWLVIIINMIYM